ncbi:MAG TPA: hypothetical protein VJ183_03245 [Chloroflexia bacterium]|nr:hypothetical protein [Chloroflexia bacterium]
MLTSSPYLLTSHLPQTTDDGRRTTESYLLLPVVFRKYIAYGPSFTSALRTPHSAFICRPSSVVRRPPGGPAHAQA